MTPRRRIAVVLAAILALLAGCGGGDKASQGSIAESLGYLPKDSALVVALDTDTKSGQYKNIDRVLGRFAFGGQIKNQLRQLYARGGRDYDRDIAPLLGNPVVIGSADTNALLRGETRGALLVAWKTKDADKMRKSIKAMGQRKIGTIEGADAYEAPDGFVSTARGDQFVGSYSRPLLAQALKTHGGPGKMTEADLDGDFQGLPDDSILRVTGDAHALINSSPESAAARKIKWVAGLRRFAAALTVDGDGVAVDARVATEGVGEGDLPIAGGDASPALARFSDYSLGARDLSHAARFILGAVRSTDPPEFADFEKQARTFRQKTGVDVERDLIDQFSGGTTVAGGFDGSYGLRATVGDPAAMRSTLAKLGRAGRVDDTTFSQEGGLVKAVDDDGPTYLGMIGDVFVAGPDPGVARQLASVDPAPVDGARGSIVFVTDGEKIANTIIKRSGRNGSAALFTGPIGDLTAWVTASPTGLLGHAKLKVE